MAEGTSGSGTPAPEAQKESQERKYVVLLHGGDAGENGTTVFEKVGTVTATNAAAAAKAAAKQRGGDEGTMPGLYVAIPEGNFNGVRIKAQKTEDVDAERVSV